MRSRIENNNIDMAYGWCGICSCRSINKTLFSKFQILSGSKYIFILVMQIHFKLNSLSVFEWIMSAASEISRFLIPHITSKTCLKVQTTKYLCVYHSIIFEWHRKKKIQIKHLSLLDTARFVPSLDQRSLGPLLLFHSL